MSRPDRGGADALVRAALVLWIASTVLAQHPQRQFDGLRRVPVLRSLLPDWRFFAPRPLVADLVPIVRWVDADGLPSGWRRMHPPRRRRALDAVWFPDGRRVHALVDICRELTLVGSLPPGELDGFVPLLLLRDMAESRVEATEHERYQLAVLSEAPYAQDDTPRVAWMSPVLPVRSERLRPGRAGTT